MSMRTEHAVGELKKGQEALRGDLGALESLLIEKIDDLDERLDLIERHKDPRSKLSPIRIPKFHKKLLELGLKPPEVA